MARAPPSTVASIRSTKGNSATAVFLVGGDKSGKWSDWYRTAIPRAEDAYTEHLRIEGKK
jgi:hypothetical protein